METKYGWREDQKKLRREHLNSINRISFLLSANNLDKGCPLDHIDGTSGYISLEDAITEEWNIFDVETDTLLGTIESMDKLIEDGWRVRR